MTWKVLAKTPTGNATRFGGEDTDKINQFLGGVADVDTADINSLIKFRHGKWQLLTAAGANAITFNSAATGTKTQTFPDETGTFLTSATGSVIKNNQNNALGAFYEDLTAIAVPANPGSATIRRIFVNSADNNKLYVLRSDGTTVPLERLTTDTEILQNKTIDANLNTILNVWPYPDKKLSGIYGPHSTTAMGLGTLLQGVPTGTGGSLNTSVTAGKFITFTTTTTTDDNKGIRLNNSGGFIVRGKAARFKCRFRLNTQTNARLFVGLFNSTSVLPTGEDPLAATAGIGLMIRSADTVFQIASSAAGGATVFQSTGVTKDAAIHTIEIRANSGDTGWEYSVDGATFATVTGAAPASGTTVGATFMIQNSATAVATADHWYTVVECDP